MKYIPIFSQRLAGYLMMNGYRLLKIEPNRKRPDMNVFFFEDSEGLRQCADDYKISREKIV